MRDTGRPSNLLFPTSQVGFKRWHGRQAAGKALSCTLTDRYSVRPQASSP